MDPEEPLSPAGASAVEATARAVRRIDVRVDRVVTSDKRRARETADLMAPAVGVAPEAVEVTPLVKAMTPPSETIEYLARHSGLEAILVVGHLPSLGGVSASLLSNGSPVDVQFERSGICRIDVETLPTQNGSLVWHLTPALIAHIDPGP
jgi:phosphohistidine phosphatase